MHGVLVQMNESSALKLYIIAMRSGNKFEGLIRVYNYRND